MSPLGYPRVIAITGASGGLGGALALEYAAPGITLVLHGRDVSRLRKVSIACEAAGATVISCMADLRDSEVFMSRFAAAISPTALDLLIINAGTSNAADGDGEKWEDIARVIDVNLRGALATLACSLPALRRSSHGQVALISSLAARVGMPVTPTYAATKAALSNYGDAMRALLAPQGIALSVVCPGFVDTPMSRRFPSGKPFMLPPADAAHRIRLGLSRNQARICFPQALNFALWFLAAIPAPLAQVIMRLFGYGR
jgi:short-subunit dehydrogenase